MSDDLGQVVEQAVSAVETQQEKMLRQSEVNDIVGRAKSEAATRAVEQYKRSQQESAQSQQHSNYTQQSNDSMSEEKIRKLAGEEAARLRSEWMTEQQTRIETDAAKRIVKTFYDKLATGKDKFDDFDQVTNDVKLERFPNTVHMLAEHIDNADEVMYEISKNRSKLARIEQTSRDFPEEALWDLKRLSESIKANNAAGLVKTPRAPLSQQRSSNVGTDSGGALSMRDLKAKYKA
jgi:hypothetical protein